MLTNWGEIAKKSKCLNRDFYDSMINKDQGLLLKSFKSNKSEKSKC